MDSFKAKREQEEQLKQANTAFEKAKADRNGIIGAHLKNLSEAQAEDSQILNIVVQAAIRAKGLPRWPSTNESFALQTEDLAARISQARRRREWSQVKELLESLNARDPNVLMVASAKRAGVELVEAPPVDPPRLVQG